MSRVQELEDQIRKLQEEKRAVFSEERKLILNEVRAKIALFGFTAKELKLQVAESAEPTKGKSGKAAGKTKAAKKGAKKAQGRSYKPSGMYFDLGELKVPCGRGRPSKEVSAYAAEHGVTTDSLKRNADGSPVSQ